MRDFYATMAQVFPVLMLALVWESSFLERLRGQARRLRRDDPAGVRFWTKRRVRNWTVFVVVVAALGLALCCLVLAGALADSVAARAGVLCGLAIVLGTLLTRAVVDTVQASRAE